MSGCRRPVPTKLVGPGRFELPTSPLSGVRSNQLSYGPEPCRAYRSHKPVTGLRHQTQWSGNSSREERETKAAVPAITPYTLLAKGSLALLFCAAPSD